ncbi:MAG: hypothetical protein P4M09_19380 [Devosia sp.]|nr:hypothetical protein [Devosia sp.]
MSVVRSAIAAVELTVAVVGIAVAVSRHPLVRAGLRAAPHLMTPGMKQAAADTALNAAYGAGALARRIVPRSLIG